MLRGVVMSLIIVEYLPYFAFFAAGVLVAWVGADVLRSKRRRQLAAPQDSGRGLAGPVEPLREPVMAPAEELELPVSQAVGFAPAGTSVKASAAPAQSRRDIKVEATAAASEKMVLVRRDPSVRVFDTAVAANERKVSAD
jgi:hypothetical protein